MLFFSFSVFFVYFDSQYCIFIVWFRLLADSYVVRRPVGGSSKCQISRIKCTKFNLARFLSLLSSSLSTLNPNSFSSYAHIFQFNLRRISKAYMHIIQTITYLNDTINFINEINFHLDFDTSFFAYTLLTDLLSRAANALECQNVFINVFCQCLMFSML